MIGGKRSYLLGGAFNDGKGQPGQVERGEPRLRAVSLPRHQRHQHRTDRVSCTTEYSVRAHSCADPAARYLTRDECQAIASGAIVLEGRCRRSVTITERRARQHALRGEPDLHRAATSSTTSSAVQAAFGKRVGDVDDQQARRRIAQGGRRSRRSASRSSRPRIRRSMPELGPQRTSRVDVTGATPRRSSTPRRARSAVKRIATPARNERARRRPASSRRDANVARRSRTTRASSRYRRDTTAPRLTTTVRTHDGTRLGLGRRDARRLDRKIDAASTGSRAAEKARTLGESGGDRAGSLHRGARADGGRAISCSSSPARFNARAADEGRSFFSKQGGGNKLGQKVVDERVTSDQRSDGSRRAGAPFAADGLAARQASFGSRTAS